MVSCRIWRGAIFTDMEAPAVAIRMSLDDRRAQLMYTDLFMLVYHTPIPAASDDRLLAQGVR